MTQVPIPEDAKVLRTNSISVNFPAYQKKLGHPGGGQSRSHRKKPDEVALGI